jgi:hypothetical protein
VPPIVAKTTGHHLTVSFGNATAIRDKVIAGDRVDVVVLPPMQIDELIGRGLLLAASRADLGSSAPRHRGANGRRQASGRHGR